MTPAWIELDGLDNMRDLGGTPTRDGGVIQPGRLIRSDNLQGLTETDVVELIEHRGVSDIVDLRSDVELQLTGPGPLVRIETLHHHHLSLFRDKKASIDDALVLPWTEPDEAERNRERDDNHWANHYLGYLAQRPDSITAALGVIANAHGAAVVHCAAGKDRTGTVVALALSVAGVDDDDIVADYLASAERIERIVQRLSGMPAYAENLRGRPLSQQTPDPEAMPRVLGAVRQTAGSVEDWLLGQGWQESDLDRLRRRLLDPA